MIQHIQESTEEAVRTIQQGISEVRHGKESADRAQGTVAGIIERSRDVADAIMQVAAATEEQSQASEEVLRNAEVIKQITETTSAGIIQIAHAVEDVSKLAIHLETVIRHFNIGNNNHKKQAKSAPSPAQAPEFPSTFNPSSNLLV
jgi:methyl-accepting chemotaxis protein